MDTHVVHFSGGVGSWAAAKRVAEQHGTDNMVLLFADTKMEDEDLYRFIEEAAANVGCELTVIADGRTPWQLFHEQGMMGSSRVDLCSRVLKRELLNGWVRENHPDAVNVFGIDVFEKHRFARVAARLAPVRSRAPLCENPYLSKDDMLQWLDREGLKRPRLYDMGFPHNNCGGFCVKAGQANFINLLKMLPDRYDDTGDGEGR
jgi:3'-phosphoadenosine 5'-phosphosulfate sulfotransferase (PAPS reductase)/FAD synthetase